VINILNGQNEAFTDAKAGGTHSNHCTFRISLDITWSSIMNPQGMEVLVDPGILTDCLNCAEQSLICPPRPQG
jgi:hypothetical protein